MTTLDRTPSDRGPARAPRDADPRDITYIPRRHPEAARLAEIARRLGVSPSTLRQYYDCQEAEIRADR